MVLAAIASLLIMPVSTLSSWVLPVVQTLDAYAVDGRALLQRAGLDPDLLRDPNARYSYTAITRFWNMAAAASQDPAFGLAVTRFWHPTTLHALGFAWLASTTLRDALQRLTRYAHIVNNAVEFTLTEHNGETVLSGAMLSSSFPRASAAAVDATAAVLIHMCRISAGQSFAPQRVAFRHPAPVDTQPYEDYFQAPVSFGCPHDELSFTSASLTQSLPSGNAALAMANEQIIIDYLARFERSSFTLRVKMKLIEQLPAGHIEQTVIARQLNTSLRNLQRQLQQEGTSFRQLLDETRRDLALGYVSDATLMLSEVAYLLGFSEPANFTRAFRRWTGRTPSGYRAAV